MAVALEPNFLTRDDLAEFLPTPRAIRAFETQFQQVATNAQDIDSIIADTNSVKDATFLTLSLDGILTNERVLTAGNLIDFDDTGPGGTLTVKVDKLSIAGAFTLALTLTGNSTLTMPTTGTLSTLAGTETLTNKTLNAPTVATPPKITGIGDFVDDVAAAAGGVPIGGVYRTASALKVRVT